MLFSVCSIERLFFLVTGSEGIYGSQVQAGVRCTGPTARYPYLPLNPSAPFLIVELAKPCQQ